MPPTITLHLGAHRTATTSLQTLLVDRAVQLSARGIVCLVPPRPGRRDQETIRGLLDAVRSERKRRGPFKHLTRAVAKHRLRGRLDRLAKEQFGTHPERVIVSEEMLLGPAFDRTGDAIYPDLTRALGPFLTLCSGRIDHVHLTVRSYASFLVSVYAMRAIYAGPLPPFEDLAATLCAPRRRWPDVVADIRGLLGTNVLEISQFETSTLADRARWLTGAPDLFDAASDVTTTNIAPSDRAVRLAVAQTERLASPDAFIAEHAGPPRFAPLTPEQKNHLDLAYAQDLDTLANMRGVSLLSGGLT